MKKRDIGRIADSIDATMASLGFAGSVVSGVVLADDRLYCVWKLGAENNRFPPARVQTIPPLCIVEQALQRIGAISVTPHKRKLRIITTVKSDERAVARC